LYGEGKYLVCAGEEKRKRKRRKTFGGEYLKKGNYLVSGGEKEQRNKRNK